MIELKVKFKKVAVKKANFIFSFRPPDFKNSKNFFFFIAHFYYSHIRQYRLPRQGVLFIYRFFFSIVNFFVVKIMYCKFFINEKIPKNIYNLIKLADFAKTNKNLKSNLIKASSVRYIEPDFFRTVKIRINPLLKSIKAPSIYVIKIENALIRSNNSFIFKDHFVISHDLFQSRLDYTSEELHSQCIIIKNFFIDLQKNSYEIGTLDKCAHFLEPVSSNYAHWISEVLPRITAFCLDARYKDIPIVINDSLHHNLIESLLLIAGKSRPILQLSKNQRLIVKELYAVSVAGYVPFEPRNKITTPSAYNLHILKLMRNVLLKSLYKTPKKWPNKIYLKRNSLYRNLVNFQEIESLLSDRGFVIYDFEKETFTTQLGLFANAKVIIGATGAHFGNLVFASSQSKFAILISDKRDTLYEYWPRLASINNIKVNYIIGESKGNLGGVHSNFLIEPQMLLRYLNDNKI